MGVCQLGAGPQRQGPRQPDVVLRESTRLVADQAEAADVLADGHGDDQRAIEREAGQRQIEEQAQLGGVLDRIVAVLLNRVQ